MSVSTASEAPSSVREASYPFNKPEADIILRSSDQVNFRVRRHILLEASPVFESILSIPQPPSTSEAPSTLPTVGLTEDSTTLDILLRICYPIVKPTTTRSFDQIESAVKAAQKYEMELALAMLTDELQAAISRSPLEVWAVACRTRLEKVARAVAQRILHTPAIDFTVLGRMEGICAGDYYRFLEFRRLKGVTDASFRLLDPSATPNSVVAGSTDPAQEDRTLEFPYADIACQAPDGTRFHAHKTILSAASPMLQAEIDTLLHPYKDLAESTASTALPVLSLDISGSIMPAVIRACYPSTIQLPTDPRKFAAIFAAVRKYGMNRIAKELYHSWEAAAVSDPLTAYLAASRHGLDDLARLAAKHTLARDIDREYRDAMESCPAISYHHLLNYHHTCHKIGVDALASVVIDRAMATKSPFVHHVPVGQFRPSPSFSFGSPSTAQTSTSAWLPEYVDRIRRTAQENPVQLLNGSGFRPFEDATIAKQWCSLCQPLAACLSSVTSALDKIPTQVQAVTLVI